MHYNLVAAIAAAAVGALALTGCERNIAAPVPPPIAIEFDPDGRQSGFWADPGDTIRFRIVIRDSTGATAVPAPGSMSWLVRDPAIASAHSSSDGATAVVVVRSGGITWLVGMYAEGSRSIRDSTQLFITLRDPQAGG